MQDSGNAQVRRIVRAPCVPTRLMRGGVAPRTLRVSHIDHGTADVALIAQRGVWAVTRSCDGRGFVVTHVPSGCAVRYNGVLHRRRLALKIMRALHAVAPLYRSGLPLLQRDVEAARDVAWSDDADTRAVKQCLATLYLARQNEKIVEALR